MAEHWFGRTKPEKVKKGFKTKEGLIKVLRALAVKITDTNWKQRLNINRDINDATKLLISGLLKKKPA